VVRPRSVRCRRGQPTFGPGRILTVKNGSGRTITFHPQAEEYGRAFTIENFALFGRPIESGSVRVHCINRLVLTQIGYRGHFGPVTY
ncbi:MAG: hypothetical protein B7X65_23160, partial [Polaromonas sp. 39-63-25]